MAHYTIAFACGHTETRQLFGPTKERERKIAYFEKYGDCSACYKANEAQTIDAIEQREALPGLTGSPKQISWARKIRAEVVTLADEFLAEAAKAQNMTGRMMELLHTLRAEALAHTEAKWYIDHAQRFDLREMARDDARVKALLAELKAAKEAQQ